MPSSSPLRVLILGGTGFIGPRFVDAALARGHQVAVFNRGTNAARVPANVEQLVGSRPDELDAIRNRDWDAVIDLAVYDATWVAKLGAAIADRTAHYTFISTEHVFTIPDRFTGTIVEGDAVATRDTSDDMYAIVKAESELAAEEWFPGRTLVLRPNYLVGPGDFQGHLDFLAVRLSQPQRPVLVAGDPTSPVQFLDVRDLGNWAIDVIERKLTGTFNASGPAEPLSYGELLDAVAAATGTSADFAWVPAEALDTPADRERFGPALFWTDRGYGNRCRIDNSRARAEGFRTRPLSETLADGFAAYARTPVADRPALISEDWNDYLARERELTADWASSGSSVPRSEPA
jgi:2'-hydroxyisoflavone reductase